MITSSKRYTLGMSVVIKTHSGERTGKVVAFENVKLHESDKTDHWRVGVEIENNPYSFSPVYFWEESNEIQKEEEK